MRRYSGFLLGAALLLLAGCASVGPAPGVSTGTGTGTGSVALPQEPIQPGSATPEPTAQTSPVLGGDVAQAGDLPGAAEPPPLPPVSGNRAVVALLDRAQLDAGAGHAEAAGATLERALRIEPRNARLWHELAQLRLAQGLYAQAVALAQKSNSFAGTQRRLQAMNWRVIGQARIAQGQAEAGQKALTRAAELEP